MTQKLLTVLLGTWLLCLAQPPLLIAQFDDFSGFGPFVTEPSPIRKQPVPENYVAKYPVPAGEAAILRKLQAKFSPRYSETPLQDFVKDFGERFGLQVLLDEAEIVKVGYTLDEPLTLHVEEISAAAALQLILEPLGLTWIDREGVLIITTSEIAEEFTSRLYEVSDLVLTQDDEGHLVADFQTLIDVIQQATDAAWEDIGMNDHIDSYETTTINALCINQSARAFAEVDQLLRDLRQVRSSDAVVTVPPKPDWFADLEKHLARHIDLELNEVTLREALDHFAEQTEAPLVVDQTALKDVNIPLDQRIRFSVRDVPALTAFDMAFGHLEIVCDIRHEVLVVTTREIAEEHQQTRVYDVRDLVTYEARAGETVTDADALIELLYLHCGGSWENIRGVGGTVNCYKTAGPPVLVVQQTQPVHRNIERLLRNLRALRDSTDSTEESATAPQ
jgi:hypothetical protein